MKRFLTISLVIVILSLFCSQAVAKGKEINAKLIHYNYRYTDYWLLIPDNIATYNYLSHYPLTAFRFVINYNENKIDNLTVNKLREGRLDGYYNILSFEKIKGFEDAAKELKTLDEFSASAKKKEFITKLKNCYKKYENEYKKYLNNIYVFKNEATWRGGRQRIHEYSYKVNRILPEYNHGEVKGRYYIKRDNYNFDDKTITLGLLMTSPNWRFSSNWWEYYYKDKFSKKYKRSKTVSNIFPDAITMPLSIENAKKLFGDKTNAFGDTFLTIKPKPGFFGRSGTLSYIVSNFDIIKITKKFYGEDTGSEEPVLMFEIDTTKNKPLY